MREYFHRRSLAIVLGGAILTAAPLFSARLSGMDGVGTMVVGVLSIALGLFLRHVTRPPDMERELQQARAALEAAITRVSDGVSTPVEPPSQAQQRPMAEHDGGEDGAYADVSRGPRVAAPSAVYVTTRERTFWLFGALALAGASSASTYLWVARTHVRPVIVVDAMAGDGGERCTEGYRLIGWQASPARSAAVLSPDLAKPVDYKRFYDASTATFDSAMGRASESLALSQDELKRLAQAQGVDLEAIFKARQKGRAYEEIAAAGRERGVIGFMPLADRERAIRSAAICEER